MVDSGGFRLIAVFRQTGGAGAVGKWAVALLRSREMLLSSFTVLCIVKICENLYDENILRM